MDKIENIIPMVFSISTGRTIISFNYINKMLTNTKHRNTMMIITGGTRLMAIVLPRRQLVPAMCS